MISSTAWFSGEFPVYILSDEEYLDCFVLKTYLSASMDFPKMDYTPQRIIKGTRPLQCALNKFGS